MVEQVHLRGTTIHEQKDDPFGSRGKMWFPGC